jgi:redox-sensitive bicupin YhaK (pirin superfamily)
MSYFATEESPCGRGRGEVALLITPREADLGEFSVRRALPSRERRMVGPFVFFDHMGPADFPPGRGLAVRPHPHIGIATITYLFEGEIMHRDSLGSVQAILPGAVNLMVAGRGIVHSERAGADLQRQSRLNGIQSWIALPESLQERDPAFTHYPAGAIPVLDQGEHRVRVIMGAFAGTRSPVTTFSDTLYLDVELAAGTLELPGQCEELALYVAAGRVEVSGTRVQAGQMAVLGDTRRVCLAADAASRVIVIGGANLGPRELYWNFVSTRQARIEQAKADWRAGRFGGIAGDPERIPLPGEGD